MPQSHKPSGQKITVDRVDSGLNLPLQNSPAGEFCEGWRGKPLAAMTEGEVDRFFDEVGLLAAHDGVMQ